MFCTVNTKLFCVFPILHLPDNARFDGGKNRKEVVEDLLGGHAKRISPGRHFHPPVFVSEILLGEVLGTNINSIGVICEFHGLIVAHKPLVQ